MDVDRLLNLERRTGVKDSDIHDFERKVNDVEAAIKGLVAGTLKPEDVKVEGIDTEEEKAEKERQRLERRRVLDEKEKKLKEERKKEERERWWAGVEIFRPKPAPSDAPAKPSPSEEEADKTAMMLNRYKADYSHWNSWTPTDEASLAEQAEAERKEEEIRNREFEKNNAEFCDQFLTDMEKRKKVTEKKQESADISRLKGNRYFKAKSYEKALELYMEALRECPFDAKTVNNVAQVYIKMKNYDDALEFLARTLYLEPTNIKALSRKALVLGEQGHCQEAVEVIQAALALEPGNADIIAQSRELSTIVAEKAAESAVAASVAAKAPAEVAPTPVGQSVGAAATAASAAPAASVVAPAKAAPAQRVDSLLVSITAIQASLSVPAFSVADNVSTIRDCAKEFVAATAVVVAEADMRVYARTSGLLAAAAETCRSLCAARDRVSADSSELSALLADCFRFLAAAVAGQRASKLLLLDAKLISTAKAVLQSCLLSDLNLSESVLQLLHVCCEDDVAVKTRAAIVTDKQVMGLAAGVLGNVSFRINSTNSVLTVHERSALNLSAKILKVAAFADSASSTLVTLDGAAAASVVCGIACALHMIAHAPAPSPPKASSKSPVASGASNTDILELLIELSLGVSQIETMRPLFAQDTPIAENTLNKSKFSAGLCKVIVNTIAAFPQYSVNATAALMNACLEPSNSVRGAIIAAGGLPLATSQLPLTDAQRAELDGVDLVRKAGLLARLAGDAEVQKTLQRADNYRMLCRRISLPTVTVPETVGKWRVDERAHYVRILANLTAPTADCMAIGMEEGILSSILSVFPTPREDCGEITAASVTLMPKDLAPALLLGNAARCLMPYADVPAHAEQLYANKKLFGVEKLICAMASCPDMRVRKNIAILLAKGCRVPGVREKMTTLRGMQMMVELQNSL